MPRINEATAQKRRIQILTLHELEPSFSNREVGRRLGINESTVRRVLQNWTWKDVERHGGLPVAKKGSGRRTKVSPRFMRCGKGPPRLFLGCFLPRILGRVCLKNKDFSLRQIAREVFAFEEKAWLARPEGCQWPKPNLLSPSTLREYAFCLNFSRVHETLCLRYLTKVNIRNYAIPKAPFLTRTHRRKRLQFAKENMLLDWSKV